jgi:hypothetical protein
MGKKRLADLLVYVLAEYGLLEATSREQPHHLQRGLKSKTLGIMLIIAVIGVPLVLTYTVSIY